MQVINRIDELKSTLVELRSKGKTIGLVPTMGFLHEGHISLIKCAEKENDIVVVSIFVNPTQFGPGEDFERYPRDLERDEKIAAEAGADFIFHPDVNEMYATGFQTFVEVENVTKTLCGASRPSHFRGVTTVVNKLFNIVSPNRAYFGQKDAQQTVVINRMVKDLNMNLEIVVCPIIREADGLAKSSRNIYLNTGEREQAIILYNSLTKANEWIKAGERSAQEIKRKLTEMIKEKPLADIDYVSIVDFETLQDVDFIDKKALIALAVRFGKTRLIDNMILEV